MKAPGKISKARGFTMIELVVSASIFVILFILIFSFFRFGTRAFQRANAKHGLQVDALRVMESLQTDFRRTHFASTTISNGPDRVITAPEGPEQRDAISFLGLKSWSRLTDFDNYDEATGAPLWNRYHIFYATLEPEGKLIRERIDPVPPPHSALRLPQDDFDKLLNTDPMLNKFDAKTVPYVILCKNVLEFDITTHIDDPVRVPTGEVEFSLKLKQKRQKGPVDGGPVRPFDYYELRSSIRPENTFPNDLL